MSAKEAAGAFLRNRIEEVAAYCVAAPASQIVSFVRQVINQGGSTALNGTRGKLLEDRLIQLNAERKLPHEETDRERFAVCHLGRRVSVPVERRAIVYDRGRPICCFSIVGERSEHTEAVKQVSLLREKCGRADSVPIAPLSDGTARPT